MKTLTLLSTLALTGGLHAQDAFRNAIRPISNPTIFDLAVPRTQVHGIFMNQNHPRNVNTIAGPVPIGGDLQLYALQFEYAFNERTSFVATKDGYIDFNPDNTLNSESGFADLGLGIKRALIYRPENQYILSGIATVEVPTGQEKVWQGVGDGILNLNLAGLKMYDKLQIASNMGLSIPFDDSQSFTGAVSLHASYEVSPWFIPLIELNWFHTFDDGDGSLSFSGQGGNLVPSIAQFEGGDLINLGSANASDNRDTVLMTLGFRSRINECFNVGVGYEFPLTEESDGLLEDRLTLDFVWTF